MFATPIQAPPKFPGSQTYGGAFPTAARSLVLRSEPVSFIIGTLTVGNGKTVTKARDDERQS